MRYVSEKSTSNHEIGKQLQVTVIKVTESKENKSIHRLDVSGSEQVRGRGGGGGQRKFLLVTQDVQDTSFFTIDIYLDRYIEQLKVYSLSTCHFIMRSRS